MKESKLLLSQFANEEGFELTNYLTQLFEYVSQQLGQTSTVNVTTEIEKG
jgi:flagellin-specific chaperone FliS